MHRFLRELPLQAEGLLEYRRSASKKFHGGHKRGVLKDEEDSEGHVCHTFYSVGRTRTGSHSNRDGGFPYVEAI